MKSQHLNIKTADGVCDSLLAQPEKNGRYPAILLLTDAFGLRPYIEEMVAKLASNGYIVLAPNLFYRLKHAPVVSLKFPLKAEDMPQARSEIMPLVRGYQIQPGLQDMGVFLEFLKNQKHFNGKIGLVGYCMGGAFAIRTAAHYSDQIFAAASFHAGNMANETHESPHLLLPQIKAELYVAHADNDASMTAEQIAQFQNAFSESKTKGHAELYQGALHGFTMADLPAYNKAALEKHWEKLLDLFARKLIV